MAYKDIPLSTDKLSTSQADIRTNFSDIQALITVNHGDFDAADEGKHTHVSLPEQGASPTTAADEVALFSRQSTLTGVAELAVRKESDGTVNEFTSSTAATNGWTRLPSGILLKWGIQTVSVTGDAYLTYPVAATVPAFTTVFSAQVSVYVNTVNDSDTAIRVSDVSDATKLRVYGSHRYSSGSAATTFTWFAIGV